MAKIPSSEAKQSDLDAIKKSLQELESPKAKRDRERTTAFAELYPDIRSRLNFGVKKSAIIKALAAHGLTIRSIHFDQLLESEAKSRGQVESAKTGGIAAREMIPEAPAFPEETDMDKREGT